MKVFRPKRWKVEAIILNTPEDVEEAVKWHNTVIPSTWTQWEVVPNHGKIRTENSGHGIYVAQIPDCVVRLNDGSFHIMNVTLFSQLFVEDNNNGL